jgi:DNA (cytosine-5)-methyltransferase 1
MTRPRLLDLFCGAGGAAVGYHRAGFDVVGVDIAPQPHYPFEFHQADALVYLDPEIGIELGDGLFDAVHASPPCQAYIRSGVVAKDGRHPDLLGVTRALLDEMGLPYVIENVPGAPMRADVLLCGSMFGLEVRRHRWFESSMNLPPWTLTCDHSKPVAGVYGNAHGAAGAWPGMLPSDLETWQRAMGIDWMTTAELAHAIPPAYTEHVGGQLLAALAVTA